jgi:hypothetical protein
MDQTTLVLQQQLRDSMDDEIATRIKDHQTRIASIRTATATGWPPVQAARHTAGDAGARRSWI